VGVHLQERKVVGVFSFGKPRLEGRLPEFVDLLAVAHELGGPADRNPDLVARALEAEVHVRIVFEVVRLQKRALTETASPV
jgi:hypothetical protein